jgi:F420H(2)-dependent quinone reductase
MATMSSREAAPTLRTRLEHAIDRRSVRFGTWLLRRTRGRAAHLWRRRALALTTVGRRSGRARTVVLQFFPDGADYVVVAANSGMPEHPAWYLNLTACPAARVEVEGRRVPVRAVELGPDEAARWWPRVLAAAPDYARFRERTDRTIPVLRLVPVGEAHPGP